MLVVTDVRVLMVLIVVVAVEDAALAVLVVARRLIVPIVVLDLIALAVVKMASCVTEALVTVVAAVIDVPTALLVVVAVEDTVLAEMDVAGKISASILVLEVVALAVFKVACCVNEVLVSVAPVWAVDIWVAVATTPTLRSCRCVALVLGALVNVSVVNSTWFGHSEGARISGQPSEV